LRRAVETKVFSFASAGAGQIRGPTHGFSAPCRKSHQTGSSEPLRSFGFKLRADAERPARWEMFELLRSAFAADSPVRLDYVKTGPGAGEILRVANG
jgi:hypothetical protein